MRRAHIDTVETVLHDTRSAERGDCGAWQNNRVIVMAAPNGARRRLDEHPQVPVTATGIADCAASVLRAGASVLHLHVRDGDGMHTLDPGCYRAALDAIRQRTGDGLIVQVTTEAAGRYDAAAQRDVVRELRPEAVSIALRELCPDDASERVAAEFFTWLERERIWPQYIVYSTAELTRFDRLRRRGLFATSMPHCLLVLGRYSDNRTGEPEELDELLEAVDCTAFPWAVCSFGRHEYAVALSALERGGHVRVGFENNLLLADGRIARDNAELVGQFTRAAAASSRTPASAAEIRDWLAQGTAGL